tara:strand:- start:117309 stop:117494 length:186 start_codon:yes stop_codon:yes gene_type:complete
MPDALLGKTSVDHFRNPAMPENAKIKILVFWQEGKAWDGFLSDLAFGSVACFTVFRRLFAC